MHNNKDKITFANNDLAVIEFVQIQDYCTIKMTDLELLLAVANTKGGDFYLTTADNRGRAAIFFQGVTCNE